MPPSSRWVSRLFSCVSWRRLDVQGNTADAEGEDELGRMGFGGGCGGGGRV